MLGKAIKNALENENNVVDLMTDAESGESALSAASFEILILDINLPDKSGLEVLKKIRVEKNSIPVLILTARSAILQKIEGLDLGSDDYTARELNTPLAAIKLQAQILASGKHPEKHAEYLQDLLAGIDRSAHLVEQLLLLSRLEVNDKNFPKERFDLAKLALVLVLSKDRKIKFHCANKNNEIKANKFYVEILIKNLLDNAIKYSFPNTEIAVEISEKTLLINNVGKEISATEIARIFDNFYRAKNSQDQSGCGLGLSIAKKIIALHSGEIFFESKSGKNEVRVVFG